MIARNVKSEPIKETPHGLDVRQMYSDPSAQIMHITLKPGESLKPHVTPVDVTFYILRGKPTIHVGDESEQFEKDTLIESPKGIMHYLSNKNKEDARILVIKAPRPISQSKLI